MKIIKLQLIIIMYFTNITLFAQYAERFIGTFRITGECLDLNHENNIFDEERDIILSAGNESCLLLDMMSFSGKSHLQVFIHNDSIFIPLQSFENFDGTQASFSGEGKVINDSIFLHYRTGGTFGVFECNCKGKKTATSNDVESVTDLQNTTTNGASLQQNSPNPFSQTTQIKFYLPQSIKTASLNIYNLQGKQLKQIAITQRGESSQLIPGSEFEPGIYLYALIANGREVDVKRMILTE